MSDDEPCGYELGHVRQPGNWRHHRVYSPYGDGRWRDFDDQGNLFSFGGPWEQVDVDRMVAGGAEDRRESLAPANREVIAVAPEAGGVAGLIAARAELGRLPRTAELFAAHMTAAGDVMRLEDVEAGTKVWKCAVSVETPQHVHTAGVCSSEKADAAAYIAPGDRMVDWFQRAGALRRWVEPAVAEERARAALAAGGELRILEPAHLPIGPLGVVGPMITGPTGEVVAGAQSAELATELVEAYNAVLERRRLARPRMAAVSKEPAARLRTRPVI